MPAAPENSLALSCEIEHREITAWRLHFWVCTQEKFSHVYKETCENVHAIVNNKTWKQPKCPLTREWINKVCGMFFKKWNIIQPVDQVQRGSFLYCPRAKNGFNDFKVLFKRR